MTNPIDASRNTRRCSRFTFYMACWFGKFIHLQDINGSYHIRRFFGYDYLIRFDKRIY